jgi:AP-2 complex subunit alpha
VISILKQDCILKSGDVELQQRAVEYVSLATLVPDETFQSVFEEMPTFPERESGILAKMKSKGGNPELSEFKGPDSNFELFREGGLSYEKRKNGDKYFEENDAPVHLLGSEKGLLYQNGTLHISFELQTNGSVCQVTLGILNKTMLPLLNFSVQPLERLNMPALRFPQTLFVHLEPRGSKKLIVQCECTSPDNECPIIEFFYQHEELNRKLSLTLPVFLSTYGTPIEFNKNLFSQKWLQLERCYFSFYNLLPDGYIS